jgi:ELWxxDGT repeat protein
MRSSITRIAAATCTLVGASVAVATPVVLAAPPTPVFTLDVNGTPTGSSPRDLTVAGSRLFFTADDGVHGEELYVTDGTAAPTLLDLNPTAGSNPLNLTAVGTDLWFAADNGTDGFELWKSDGTELGTAMVADIYAGPQDSIPNHFVAFDGFVYFSADDGVNGRELWRSDGATAALAADVLAGTGSSGPSDLVAVDYSRAGCGSARQPPAVRACVSSCRTTTSAS